MSRASRFLPLLLVLFAASGCSALIYEIVWYQTLQLAIGSTAVSLGFLLAAFMGGLCIGSIGLPRLLAKRYSAAHPLRIYAVLEVGIGICGILVLFGIPLVNRIYVAGAEHGLPGLMLRGFIAGVCLLPPTILMGASLPALVRWVENTRRGVSWWGLLYGGNTLGAVIGCLLAGFYLLRVFNMAATTYVAAVINFAIAAASWLLAARTPARSDEGGPDVEAASITAPVEESANWPVYLTIAISGATALGAEVVWTRLMAMILGSTVYVFSIILAVFLIGLALGSGLGSMALRSLRTPAGPRLALGWSQVLLTLGIAWTAYMIADSIPYWPVNPMLGTSPWFSFQLDMVRCLWAILPPALLWGASFPLACAAVSAPDRDSSQVVGSVYAANTLGAIVGALLVSITLVPAIGTQNSERAMLLLSAAAALVMLLPQMIRSRSVALTAAVTAAMLLAIQLARGVDAIPGKVIAYGRRIAISSPNSELLYTIEGRNSSVAITRWNDGAIEVDVNGHVEATTEPYDMKLQRMVGHLPGLIHPNPKSVLGIGFGAGVSAGTFTRYPGIEKITVCEIEPVIPPTSTRFFAKQDYDVYHNPRTHIVFDDARHYLMTTTEHFDIIASDPLDVFVKGTAALYTKEYFDAVKRHLNPGGMFTLYVPLYESDLRTVKSELATFFEAFPHATVWANTIQGRGYDMVFMGQEGPLRVNVDEMESRLARPDYALVAQSLKEIGVPSSIDLLGTYAGQKSDLAAWLQDAELNRDGDLRLQYIGGWGINSSMEDLIYRQLMSYRRPPGAIFTGSPQNLQALGVALNTP